MRFLRAYAVQDFLECGLTCPVIWYGGTNT